MASLSLVGEDELEKKDICGNNLKNYGALKNSHNKNKLR